LGVAPAAQFPLFDTDVPLGRLADSVANRVRPGGRWKLAATPRLLPRLRLEPSLSLAWSNEDGRQAHCESAGTLLHVGVSRSRSAIDAPVRSSEAFVKLQVDANQLRTLGTLLQAPTAGLAQAGQGLPACWRGAGMRG
jgi:hypothetical protein